jgi:hypothetical protein
VIVLGPILMLGGLVAISRSVVEFVLPTSISERASE